MSFYALFLAINHFIGCLGSEWQACPAYSPPATIIVSIITFPSHWIQQPIPKLRMKVFTNLVCFSLCYCHCSKLRRCTGTKLKSPKMLKKDRDEKKIVKLTGLAPKQRVAEEQSWSKFQFCRMKQSIYRQYWEPVGERWQL